jgi:hypothetical protein
MERGNLWLRLDDTIARRDPSFPRFCCRRSLSFVTAAHPPADWPPRQIRLSLFGDHPVTGVPQRTPCGGQSRRQVLSGVSGFADLKGDLGIPLSLHANPDNDAWSDIRKGAAARVSCSRKSCVRSNPTNGRNTN